MEQRERTILEIAVAVVFVAFLVLGSIVIINAGSDSKTETTTTNSFNTYNYNTYPNAQRSYTTPATKPYIVDDGRYFRVYHDYDDVIYVRDNARYSDNKRYLRYDADSRLRVVDGLFGNDINRYEVYVRNRDYAGGNFKVVFHFEDYYGNVDSHAMTYYVPAREEKLFLLKDASPSRYEYRTWWYTVDSLDKVKTESYFYGD